MVIQLATVLKRCYVYIWSLLWRNCGYVTVTAKTESWKFLLSHLYDVHSFTYSFQYFGYMNTVDSVSNVSDNGECPTWWLLPCKYCPPIYTQTLNWLFFTWFMVKNFMCISNFPSEPGWHQYSDSLWAGWSGDRIPVGARFSAPIQTGPGAYPASYTRGTGSLPWG